MRVENRVMPLNWMHDMASCAITDITEIIECDDSTWYVRNENDVGVNR